MEPEFNLGKGDKNYGNPGKEVNFLFFKIRKAIKHIFCYV